MVAVAQGAHARLDDVSGGGEVGLADSQVDDVAALSGQLRGTGKDGESIFIADPVETADGGQQACSPKKLAFRGGQVVGDLLQHFSEPLPAALVEAGHSLLFEAFPQLL